MLLKVENMTCGGCVNSVRRILVKQLDVAEDSVTVNLDGGTAEIPEVAPERVESAIEKLGKAGFDSQIV